MVRLSVVIDDFMNAESVSSELKKINLTRAKHLKKESASGSSIRDRRLNVHNTTAASEPTALKSAPVHTVRFTDTVSCQQVPSTSFSAPEGDHTGYVPVPMSPKKIRRSFLKGFVYM